jgi:peptidoglycan/xylan/chitin deacetylase (PgdA/CDA1 family)/SAM-dependent methyltransferase
MRPGALVSVVMAAFNGADTLIRAVGSVQRQTFTHWELVVVDDGSTDATPAVLADLARADPRIRIITLPNNEGVCAARNRGIAAATGEALLFLDADDWIADDAIATLCDALDTNSDAIAAYGRFARVTPGGEALAAPFASALADHALNCLAHRCPVTINSVLVRRQSIMAIGGFAPLDTCEDWDLWVRLASTGARFVGTDKLVAYYAMRQGSLSGNYRQMLRDGLAVQRNAASMARRSGDDIGPQPAACYAIWTVAAALAAGQDIQPLVHHYAPLQPATLDPQMVAAILQDALMVGAQGGPSDAALAWPRICAALRPVVEGLSDSPDPSQHWRRIARRASLAFAANVPASHTPYEAPYLNLVAVDLARIEAIDPPSKGDADTLGVIWLESGGEVARSFLPGAAATAHQLRMRASDFLGEKRVMAAASLPYRLKKRFLRARLWPGQSPLDEPALSQWQQHIADGIVGTLPAQYRHEDDPVVVHAQPSRFDDASGWDTLFAQSDPYDLDNAYEDEKRARILAMLADEPLGEVFEPGCAEGHLTILLAARAEAVTALDISSAAIRRAKIRLGGAENVTWIQSGLLEAELSGPFDTIVCSELLYLLPSEEAVAAAVAAMRDALREGGRLLSVHAFMINDQPDKTGIDSDLPFGGERIATIIAATLGLTAEQTLRTPLYRIDRWRKGPCVSEAAETTCDIVAVPERLAPAILWGGAAVTRSQAIASMQQRHVPVLMFHRVADTGPAALARWRISERRLDAILALLRRHGFYSINSAQFAWFSQNRQPIRGRPVMLTFDDGTQDFARAAAPVLARHDLKAEIFAVTSMVGKAAAWDSQYGPAAPLMDWPTLRAMHARGHSIGSHLVSHTPVDALSTEALFAEMLESRLVLERQLGAAVTSMAYPFGVVEERAIWLARDAGYDVAFTTAWGHAGFAGNQLALPRIEVWPEMTDSQLLEAVSAQ